jgi:anthranilate synthase component 2
MPRVVLIDNYDSFTWNLVHYFGQLGQDVLVHRNDGISVDQVIALKPKGVVLSPGPCDPDRAGICLELVHRMSPSTPILGVCLGHQTIGQVFGGQIVRAPKPMHGKVSAISHQGQGVFKGLPGRFLATRYHSLTIAPESVPESLIVTARSEDGVIMGVQHRDLPVHGVQFHPESIATERGHDLLRNFLVIAGAA